MGGTVLVDKLLIGRKLAQIDTYLKQIGEFSKISLSQYKNDWKTQRILERTLHILIEVCVDIANHIISDQGMRLPTGYADTFRVLLFPSFTRIYPTLKNTKKRSSNTSPPKRTEGNPLIAFIISYQYEPLWLSLPQRGHSPLSPMPFRG